MGPEVGIKKRGQSLESARKETVKGVEKVLMRESRSNREREERSESGETNNNTIARLVIKTVGEGQKHADKSKRKKKAGYDCLPLMRPSEGGLYKQSAENLSGGRVKMGREGGCSPAATMERSGNSTKSGNFTEWYSSARRRAHGTR